MDLDTAVQVLVDNGYIIADADNYKEVIEAVENAIDALKSFERPVKVLKKDESVTRIEMFWDENPAMKWDEILRRLVISLRGAGYQVITLNGMVIFTDDSSLFIAKRGFLNIAVYKASQKAIDDWLK